MADILDGYGVKKIGERVFRFGRTLIVTETDEEKINMEELYDGTFKIDPGTEDLFVKKGNEWLYCDNLLESTKYVKKTAFEAYKKEQAEYIAMLVNKQAKINEAVDKSLNTLNTEMLNADRQIAGLITDAADLRNNITAVSDHVDKVEALATKALTAKKVRSFTIGTVTGVGSISNSGTSDDVVLDVKFPTAQELIDFEIADVRNLKAVSKYTRNNDGSLGYVVIVSYDLPDDKRISTASVYYKTDAAPAEEICFSEGIPAVKLGFESQWKCAGTSENQIIIPDVNLGDTYLIKVCAKTTGGRMQELSDAPEVTCKVEAKQTIPAQPKNLTYDFDRAFVFTWEDNSNSDSVNYEVRMNKNVGSLDGLLARTMATTATVNLTERTGTVYVYSIDLNGKYSYPISVGYSYPEPEAPTELLLAEIPIGVKITIPVFPSSADKMKLIVSGDNGVREYISQNPTFVFHDIAGIYKVRACYQDLIGDGKYTRDYDMTVSPTFKPEWVADGTISMKKMDETVNQTLDDMNKNVDVIKADVAGIHGNISTLQKTDDSITAIVAKNKTDQDGVNVQLTSKITETEEKITSTVAKNKSDGDLAISQINQRCDSITSSVIENKKTQDGNNEQIQSQIKQNASSISDIVANLSTDPSKSKYSAITQLVDGVNLRVVKGDVINQINLTAEGTTIDGKYLHVTGTTKFDNDVIVGGMIKAGSITADKLTAGTISLSGNQGIAGGSVTLNENGMKVVNADGSYITHDNSGMTYHDAGGGVYAMVGATILGVANDNNYVRFNRPFKSAPAVVVSPISLQTAVEGYSSSNLFLDCRATDVSNIGFRVICRTVLKAGSGGALPINQMIVNGANTTGTYNYNIPADATHAVFSLSGVGTAQPVKTNHRDPERGGFDSYSQIYSDVTAVLTINGQNVFAGVVASGGAGNWSGGYDFPKGSHATVAMTVKTWFRWWSDDGSHSATEKPDWSMGGTGTVSSISYNTSADTPLAGGQAFFQVVDKYNLLYSLE